MLEACAQMRDWIGREDGFLLISHVSPDGDTIGSSLALYGMLKNLNKRVQVCCDQPVPKVYRFLPWSDAIKQPGEIEKTYRNVIAMDCADAARMGYSRAHFDAAEETGNIDHHKTNDAYGDHVIINHQASATGEIMFDLWHALFHKPLEAPHARDIATCLYTAICTDTGNFSYNNTTPATFCVAAALLEAGVDLMEVNQEVFRSISYGRARLKGYVLSNIELFDGGRISYGMLTRADLERFGVGSEDVEGMVDHLRDIDTVEIAILMREARDDTYKISLRSKRYADVSTVAARFHGGGHVRAAGCTVPGEIPPEKLKEQLIDAAREALKG